VLKGTDEYDFAKVMTTIIKKTPEKFLPGGIHGFLKERLVAIFDPEEK